ncbi:hypothetical protein JTE90_023229 [Oedothorax gibbosus]|uniref:SH3 domain-containing protein n=1 Tax=Oedothorax gibbosus TaxID=931172 RepID=A0AAV6TQB9_9ARAC|nr:hypothetical protein JTE90_023229 [Oedothorax gibbosus]
MVTQMLVADCHCRQDLKIHPCGRICVTIGKGRSWAVSVDDIRQATLSDATLGQEDPISFTGISPAEIMLGRQIRCRLDLVHSPSPNSNALEAPHKSFQNGEEVYIRNYASGERWVPGVIKNP